MINVAVVEDNAGDVETLKSYIARYGDENNVDFKINVFSNGMTFVTDYNASYDVIFMDVDMPLLNGMQAAEKVRLLDRETPLIFITNLAQYAISGYAVDACDYMLKPVAYAAFKLRFDKVMRRINTRRGDFLVVNRGGGSFRVDIARLRYAEVSRHMLTYYTEDGEIRARGKLGELEQKLLPHGFARCNSYYLVNLSFVTSVKGLKVFLGDTELAMSRGRKADFLEKMNMYMAGR